MFIHQLLVAKKCTYINIQRNTTNKKKKAQQSDKKQKVLFYAAWACLAHTRTERESSLKLQITQLIVQTWFYSVFLNLFIKA